MDQKGREKELFILWGGGEGEREKEKRGSI
jgi:hypothetical protein